MRQQVRSSPRIQGCSVLTSINGISGRNGPRMQGENRLVQARLLKGTTGPLPAAFPSSQADSSARHPLAELRERKTPPRAGMGGLRGPRCQRQSSRSTAQQGPTWRRHAHEAPCRCRRAPQPRSCRGQVKHGRDGAPYMHLHAKIQRKVQRERRKKSLTTPCH
eukprot:scaffold109_cov252-Pinguiococcus_pyrenoidosus.AAC.46